MVPKDVLIYSEISTSFSSSERFPLVADGPRCRDSDSQSDIWWREKLNWRSPLGPSPLGLRELHGREEEKIVGTRGDGGYQETTAHLINRAGSHGLTETEVAGMGPVMVCTRSSEYT